MSDLNVSSDSDIFWNLSWFCGDQVVEPRYRVPTDALASLDTEQDSPVNQDLYVPHHATWTATYRHRTYFP